MGRGNRCRGNAASATPWWRCRSWRRGRRAATTVIPTPSLTIVERPATTTTGGRQQQQQQQQQQRPSRLRHNGWWDMKNVASISLNIYDDVHSDRVNIIYDIFATPEIYLH
mmetsp:Transcript_40755/g.69601  ORF Transcript_40755/g.69601 Transcript_40755/m.69601 type:complete len:111 (+) Transcript_40755:95-427(+)